MNLFVIRLIPQTENIVFRDFLVSPDHSLKDLHDAILESVDFKSGQLASFLIYGEGIKALDEFPLEKLGENDKQLMDEVKLSHCLKKVGDHLTYIYDYFNEWKFEIEYIEDREGKAIELPQLIKAQGKAPIQSDRSGMGDDAEEILMNALLGDELNIEDDESFDSDQFDSLDDYEEYH